MRITGIDFLTPFIIVLLTVTGIPLNGQSIVHTVHNLSASGPGDIRAESETEICIFCHTPHNSSTRKPLWNREDPGLEYTLYGSSTTQAGTDQPDGASLLCLSCHDGTIALGSVISRAEDIAMQGGLVYMPQGDAYLGINLSDDHPVSFIYSATLAATDGELEDPASLNPLIRLEDQKLQCTSCHDPHKNPYVYFLVAPVRYSELCTFCHQKSGWQQSGHRLSDATWNGTGDNPWINKSFASVSENACENCHDPHGAEGVERLTNYLPEEWNCLNCHNGNVAAADILSDFNKAYRHEIFTYQGIHDPEEEAIVQIAHVECSDCHNPHYSSGQTAGAPDVSGPLEGVRGVDSEGNQVLRAAFEYEICYRCHADSPEKPGSPTSRQIEQNNVREEFDPANPAFHPIEAAGRNSNVPSLISHSESSMIYCSDCHGSDTDGISGPHGSIWPQILKFRYEKTYPTTESYEAYRLCYECHDRETIINSSGTFGESVHRRHIVEEQTPCNVCHDPHGISANQGTETNNTHLVNFDLANVGPSQGAFPRQEFIDSGDFTGQCYLYCHRRNHNPRTY